MIKRLLVSLLLFFVSMSWGMAADYIGKEQKYAFGAENLTQTIVEMIPDEDNQLAAAQKYGELMNQATGQVSIENLFAVCRAAGFNTYRIDGYNKCRNFIMKLLENAELEDDSGIMGGFCPGLDEKGNNPNGLKTITDQTRIGDFCSSTNIYSGEVVFRKQTYNCTCMATACNQGFQIKGGACNAIVADGKGNCLRKEYDGNSQNSSRMDCFKFCGDMGDKLGCKANTSIWNKTTNKCTCNASYDEVDAIRQSNIEKLPYSAVCGADKGKTGGTEYCVKDFSGINIGVIEASGIAEEYALLKHKKKVHCSDHYRQSGNDDWMQCVTEDKSTFYEFQFDDTQESIDGRIQSDLTTAICRLHGAAAIGVNLNAYMDGCAMDCTDALKKTAAKFGMTTEPQTSSNTNFLINLAGSVRGVKKGCILKNKLLGKNEQDKLATIDGIDNYVFYHGIQIQGSQGLIRQLRNYISGYTDHEVRTFTCDKGVNKIMNGRIEKDDVLRCYLNSKPIDFVFDDKSEAWKYVQEAGESGIQCIVAGGKYQGSTCHGLDEQQCKQADAALKKRFPGISGARWNGKTCDLLDASEAKKYDIAVQVGVGLVSAVDCAILTHTGCAILAVELAGLATELTTQELIGGRAYDFLQQSTKCKERACAVTTLRDLSGKVLSVKGSLSAQDLHAVDSELARLVTYLEPDDLSSQTDAKTWEDIVSALGGDPDDASGTALVVANKIGLIAQFASIGVSALRLTGKAVAKIAAKSAASKAAKIASATDKAVDATKAVSAAGAIDDVMDATKALDNIDDVTKATKGATSWADDLAELGVKEEKTATGGFRYRDTKTGQFISQNEVLSRIDNMPGSVSKPALSNADEFAMIGVKEESAATKSGFRYRDTKTGQFISENEVLSRLDNLPSGVTGATTKASGAVDDVATITKKVSNNFDDVIRDIKNGKNQGMFVPKQSLSDGEWKVLKESLNREGLTIMEVPGNSASYGLEQVVIMKSGSQIVDATTGATRAANAVDDVVDATRGASKSADEVIDATRGASNIADKADDASRVVTSVVRKVDDVFPDNVKFGNQGFYVSKSAMSEDDAIRLAKRMSNEADDIIAQAVPMDGTAGGRYKVVSINKADAAKLPGVRFENGGLVRSIDNSSFFRNLDVYRNQPITNIGNTPVFIEDVGSINGRGIVTIRVGEKKIPFYVSSGQAGKMDVPTGKWEVFWGIGEKGWFNKGNIQQILSHYNSSELRQIANALDSKLGDPRNIEDVIATANRLENRGKGIVGIADIGHITADQINSGLRYRPAASAFSDMAGRNANIAEITSYLKGLH